MITCPLIAPEEMEEPVRIQASAQASGPAPGRAGHYLLLILAGGCLFLTNLGGPSLWDLDEGRNATAAMEMLESGNFIVPTFNGQLRADKPVFLYWCQALSIQLFGLSEFAVRFPSALAALVALLVCYGLGRSMFTPSAGLLAGLIAGSSGFFMGASHFANPDAILSLFVVAALTAFWRGHKNPSVAWFIRIGLFCGCAVLTKGPVGLVLPALIAATYLFWERRLRILWDRRACLGAVAFLLVVLPWYIAVAVETHGEFLHVFLGEHNVRRFLSTLDNHDGSPTYYVLVLLVGMAPWSGFFLLAIAEWAWLKLSAARLEVTGGEISVSFSDSHRFLGIWLGSYLLLFSLAATKLPNYILPVAVPSALLTASFLDRYRSGQIVLPRWIGAIGLATTAAAGIVTLVVFSNVSATLPTAFHAQTGPLSAEVAPWSWTGLIPIAAALVSFCCWRRNHPTAAIFCIVLGNLFVLPLAAWAAPGWNRVKAAQPLVDLSVPSACACDIRIGAYHLEHLPSLNFYVRRQVTHHVSEAAALAFLRYPIPVYLFLPVSEWDAMKDRAPLAARILAGHPDFYRSTTIVVVTNQPPPDED